MKVSRQLRVVQLEIHVIMRTIMLPWFVNLSYSVCFVYTRATANYIIIYTCNERQIHVNKLV